MPSKYQRLIQEDTDLRAEAERLFDASVDRRFTDEETARLDAIEQEREVVAKELRMIGAQREFERTMPADAVGAVADRIEVGRDRAANKPWGHDTGAPFGEFLQAVASIALNPGRPGDPRLYQAAAQGAGEVSPSDGGFLVDMDRRDDLLNRMVTGGEILSRVDRIPISAGSNGLKINVIDEASRVAGSRYGGVQGYWVDEGTAPTATKPRLHQIKLELKKVAALGYATEELLADAAAIERVMTQAFVDELRFLVEDAIINGTGAGQPSGIIGHASEIAVAKETGQAASTVLFENIVKMWARMWSRSRGNAIWLINQDIEPQLFSMSVAVGVGGIPVYLPANGLADSPFGRLYGRVVVPVEYCATLGTKGDIILADLSQYAFIDKGGPQQAASMHVAFTTDEMAFRVTYRVDGQSKWRTVLTPFKGTNTQSPFISLAARA